MLFFFFVTESSDRDVLDETVPFLYVFFFFSWKQSGKPLFTNLSSFGCLNYHYHDSSAVNHTETNLRAWTINMQNFVTIHSQTNTQYFFKFDYPACVQTSAGSLRPAPKKAFWLSGPERVNSILYILFFHIYKYILLTTVLSHCPNRISSMGNLSCLLGGKPAVTGSRYPIYGACWVFGVSIIHRTLTWTTGSLTRTQMLMHAIAQEGVRTL